MTEPSVAELLYGAQRRDQIAWDKIVDRYGRLIWHVIMGHGGLSNEQRSDVFQGTWLTLTEHLDKIRDPERLGSWLATVARRECLRLLAHSSREELTAEIPTQRTAGDIENHLLQSERDAALWSAFATLDDQCQQLLRLLMAEPPFSYDEIAAILDLRRGSISALRRRCLNELRIHPAIVAVQGPDNDWTTNP